MKGNLSRGGQGKFDGRPEQAGQKISLQAAASKVKSIPTQTEIVISLLKQNLSPDRLNLAHEQSVQDLLDLNLRGDRAAEEEQTSGKLLRREIVLCSDAVLKQNKRGKVQDRIFLITDRCIYNLLPGSFKCKRRVFLNDILGVSFTHDSDDFLVHFMDQKDYWLISDRRNDILIELDKAFSAFCPDKSLSYQLISSSELTHFFGKSIAPNDESPNKKVVFLSDRDHDEQHDAGESGEEDAREKISSSIDNDHARSKTSLRKSRGMDAGVSKIRALVSKKKIRFLEDGFDLDLTYITKNIIAMGFPSEDLEGIYRNPMSEVQRFFETRHPNRYKIFNLCSERQYDHMKFQKRVSHYGFDDHNCPSMKQIIDLCEEVHSWLRESDENVVSIHCKAGKGVSL